MAQAHFEPTWSFIKRPAGYPTGPAVGKPALILQSQGNFTISEAEGGKQALKLMEKEK